jgi:hypothetical protein
MHPGISQEEFIKEETVSHWKILEYVNDIYPDLTYEEIAKELGTTEYAIRRALGLLQYCGGSSYYWQSG